ncbi:unnamed protein product [Alopecurus aequalis]
MAELAAGAVSSLLVVIRSEALLLRGVRDDVQFIKEEMESMKSFLAHLARWAPPGGDHDEQVRTWMNQVRLLAQDCNNCIDLYLYRGNPDIHRARRGLRGYLWWATWFLHKLVAQHRAAEQLRLLKERARDVGERRLRYGVEVPDKSGKGPMASSSRAAAAGVYAAGDEEEEEDGDDQLVRAARRASIDPRTLDDYVRVKLWEWAEGITPDAGETMSMVVVAPDTYEDLLSIVQEQWILSLGYHRTIVVDISTVHPEFAPLRPKEVLFYILRELRHAKSKPQEQGTQGQADLDPWEDYIRRLQIYGEKKSAIAHLQIKEKIEKMKIDEKLDKIKSDIQGRLKKGDGQPKGNKLQGDVDQLDLDVLLQLLVQASSQQDQKGKNKDMHRLPVWDNNKIIIKKLKEHIEGEENEKLEEEEATKHMGVEEAATKYMEDQGGVGGKVICKHMEDGEGEVSIYSEEEEKGGGGGGETTKHMEKGEGEVSIHREEDMVEGGEVIIQREEEEEEKEEEDDDDDEKETRDDDEDEEEQEVEEEEEEESLENTWIQLDEAQYAHILRKVIPKRSSTKPLQTEDRSLVKQATKTTSPTLGEDQIKKLIHDAKEDILRELQQGKYDNSEGAGEAVVPYQNSETVSEKIGQMMEKMKYEFKEQLKIKGLVDRIKNNLNYQYKSCLLYLAIFPPGHKILRSTLIGRWVAEGLTSKEDWPSSVRQANRCFDALVGRHLVYPADIGATGNVKSCVVGDPVHGFITTIARKQHIVETRLSHHLARHFSIFNDLQLRSSDRIDKFFEGLSKSSQVSLLKVLDLEGCRCFIGKNQQRYLRDICNKMLLLKYLSLRKTDITQLPGEINNLRELEVLDIRQTEIPSHATTNILLLKMKRLLVGHINLNPGNFGSSGRIPHRIDKMVNMEVLSNVKAQHSHDLKDIGKLWQLRKLGVVIDDKDSHLKNLLQTISDLHECLCSLSITTTPAAIPHEGSASSEELPDDIGSLLKNVPKILESLSIRGTTQKGRLLPLYITGDTNKLAKVTLCHTMLSQDDLKILAKLPKLRCVRLQHIVCTEHVLNFKDDEFISLKYLVVEGSDLTNITFEEGAASELENMVLSITSICSISGAKYLLKLKELQLNSHFCGNLLSSFEDATQIAKLTLCGTLLEQAALQLLTKNTNIRSLVLLDMSFGGTRNEITLEKDDFLWLNYLEVHCPSISKIAFTRGSAPRLEKIVWSASTSLSDIDKLPRLKELEFTGDRVPDEVRKAIGEHENEPSLKLNVPETED